MAQILVVDDEVGIRELLSEILADEGHQVMLAESAGDARRFRERSRPDLVLLDIWMPDTDGITLLKEWAASGQLAMAAAPLLLRGERGMRPELFARLLAAPSAPFLSGAELLAEPPSELLAKATGGILFLPDLARLARGEQRSLEFLLTRAEKHKVRLVSFSALDVKSLTEKHDFDPDLGTRL